MIIILPLKKTPKQSMTCLWRRITMCVSASHSHHRMKFMTSSLVRLLLCYRLKLASWCQFSNLADFFWRNARVHLCMRCVSVCQYVGCVICVSVCMISILVEEVLSVSASVSEGCHVTSQWDNSDRPHEIFPVSQPTPSSLSTSLLSVTLLHAAMNCQSKCHRSAK